MRVNYKWRTITYGGGMGFHDEVGPWQCGKITEKNFEWQRVEIIKYVIVEGVQFLTPVREFVNYDRCWEWLNDELAVHGNSNVGELIYG